MGFLFSTLFWSILLMVIGVTLLINYYFPFHIPLGRVLIAFIMVYMGIYMLASKEYQDLNVTIFSKIHYNATNITEKNQVLLGRAIFDFKDTTGFKKRTYRINTFFGSSDLVINPDTPIRIRMNSVLAFAQTPDNNSVVIGSHLYSQENGTNRPDVIEIQANVIMGNLNVIFPPKEPEEKPQIPSLESIMKQIVN